MRKQLSSIVKLRLKQIVWRLSRFKCVRIERFFRSIRLMIVAPRRCSRLGIKCSYRVKLSVRITLGFRRSSLSTNSFKVDFVRFPYHEIHHRSRSPVDCIGYPVFIVLPIKVGPQLIYFKTRLIQFINGSAYCFSD
jgi:hypothetical protein